MVFVLWKETRAPMHTHGGYPNTLKRPNDQEMLTIKYHVQHYNKLCVYMGGCPRFQ